MDRDQYARRTLDFVERLQPLGSYDDICREIAIELGWFGFTCVTFWTMPGPGMGPLSGILFNNRPQEYVDRYVKKKYVLRDPVVTQLRNTVVSSSWSDVRKRRELTKSETDIIDEAREFGVRDGFTVPIVTLSGSFSVFSPCGYQPNLSRRARSALEFIGIYSQEVLKRNLIQSRREYQTHMPLTPREREIMHWVASGKTDSEIGDILSISRTTVTSHVENSKSKLDAFKRTHAVVQAIRFGEISL